MSRKNLYCDQCERKQSPMKVKACPLHAVALIQKHSSVFDIVAFDFIDQAEDTSEYVRRKEIV